MKVVEYIQLKFFGGDKGQQDINELLNKLLMLLRNKEAELFLKLNPGTKTSRGEAGFLNILSDDFAPRFVGLFNTRINLRGECGPHSFPLCDDANTSRPTLEIVMHDRGDGASLRECLLHELEAPFPLEVRCDHCSESKEHTVTPKATLTINIIVHVRRYINILPDIGSMEATVVKRHTKLNFPLAFRYRGAMYELTGFANHAGDSHSSGHYTSWRRNMFSEDVWYRCNDNKVEKAQDIRAIMTESQ